MTLYNCLLMHLTKTYKKPAKIIHLVFTSVYFDRLSL